jgi:osmoprotectant transport system ATP-binding protein
MTEPAPGSEAASEPRSDSVLELRAVSLSVGGSFIVREVDLSLQLGQIGVLLGVSGAGKSSVLRLCVGLAQPTAGELSVLGVRLSAQNIAAIRPQIGYCIQDGGLFPHLTARDNVGLMPRQLGWDAQRLEQRLRELSELLRLPHARLSHYPGQLSGGERQRVGLMRALMLNPELLLLDEPFGALDPITRADLQVDLREVFRQLGKAVLMVTHDLGEAAYFADWVALMRAGSIVQQGRFSELVRTPKDDFARRFVNAQRGALELRGLNDSGESTRPSR